MIPKIQQSERFLSDYKNYQQQIAEVTDLNLQKELIDALLKLKEHVQFLDRSHEQVFMTGKMPSEVADLRSDVSRYKKILDHKLADWKHRQLNNN